MLPCNRKSRSLLYSRVPFPSRLCRPYPPSPPPPHPVNPFRGPSHQDQSRRRSAAEKARARPSASSRSGTRTAGPSHSRRSDARRSRRSLSSGMSSKLARPPPLPPLRPRPRPREVAAVEGAGAGGGGGVVVTGERAERYSSWSSFPLSRRPKRGCCRTRRGRGMSRRRLGRTARGRRRCWARRCPGGRYVACSAA